MIPLDWDWHVYFHYAIKFEIIYKNNTNIPIYKSKSPWYQKYTNAKRSLDFISSPQRSGSAPKSIELRVKFSYFLDQVVYRRLIDRDESFGGSAEEEYVSRVDVEPQRVNV